MAFLNPYAMAIKVGLVVALVATLVGGCFAMRLARAERDAAVLKAESLGESLTSHIQNADAVSRIMAEKAEKERRLNARVLTLTEEVRRARQPIPDLCRPMLDPLVVAADGVRRLRSERDGTTAPGPVVRSRPGAADRGRAN